MNSAADDYRKQFPSGDGLDSFLNANSLSSEEVLEVLLVDQFLRWQACNPGPLRDYQSWIQRFQVGETGWLELIEEEFGYRQEGSSSFDPEAFLDACRDLPQAAVQAARRLITSPVTTAQTVPKQVGRYQVIRELGVGQFGVVYLAGDPQLERNVAIKLPTHDAVARAGGDESVIREARLVAALDHPGIVPIYDIARTTEGRLYIVSKFVDGGDLASAIKRSRPGIHPSARWISKIARALHAAHVCGLVHRDVKPANILLERGDEPMLIDFGLSIRDEDPRTSHLAGSPAYMSPEQARGEGHRVDARSDIYSVGVILYELLTGARPHCGRNSEEVLQRVRQHEVRPPRQRDDSIPRELDRICMRALASRVVDRYSTALDLAEDLEAFLQQSSYPSTAGSRDPGSADHAVSFRDADTTTASADGEHGAPSTPQSGQGTNATQIVPKGLRAFDAGDSEFFLDLLPGPRDRNGLPELVRLWKRRFEQSHADGGTAVGLLYGPSGCGKSSLVRAGILPRLDKNVMPIVVNAKSEGLEQLILAAVTRVLPDLPASALPDAIATVRRDASERRVVLVFDQFEQWLQTWDGDPHCGLVEALRQCDGEAIQVMLIVRDDFWMAAARLMRELDIQIVEGVNATSVDAFTEHHARHVLKACGQAYGVIDAISPTQANEAFIQQAVAELSEHGKVYPVRLALFVQMMQDKPWNSSVLSDMGGIAGIGVKFLEESLGRFAPARYRVHAGAVQQIISALMPGASSNIRGQSRSESELRVASRYGDRPADFREVMRFLDNELRLLTPVEGDIAEGEPAETRYQLTHDYLVPSIRQWLDRQRSSTLKGRSEMALELRSDMWSRRPEWRALPTPREFLAIQCWTARRGWTPTQHQMMRVATKTYASVAGLLILIVVSASWIGREIYGRTQAGRIHAQLMVAELNELPELLPQMERWNTWLQPLLSRSIASAEHDRRARRNLAFVAMYDDSSQMDVVVDEALGGDLEELAVYADQLRRSAQSDRLVKRLSESLRSNDRSVRLRAAALLAHLGSDESLQACQESIAVLASDLISSPTTLAHFVRWLLPLRQSLETPLLEQLRAQDAARRELAALALREYFEGSTKEIADLLESADPAQFRALIHLAKGREQQLVPELQRRLRRVRYPRWPAQPANLPAVSKSLRETMEAARGWIDEDFALCQWLAIEDTETVVNQLRSAGFRLTRLRPFAAHDGLRVAACWHRDEKSWDWAIGLSRNELQERIAGHNDLVPHDVAGYLPWQPQGAPSPQDDEPRFAFVWTEPASTNDRREVYFGLPTAESDPRQKRLSNQGYREFARHLYTNRGGDLLQHSMIWGLDASHIAGSIYDVKTENSIVPFNFSFEAPVDLCVVTVDDPRCDTFYGGIWLSEDRRYDHRSCLLDDVETHLTKMKRLAADGFRPASISVTELSRGITQTASVWLRPKASIDLRWRYANERANCLAALVRLGKIDELLAAFDTLDGPADISEAMNSLQSREVNPSVIAEALGSTVDAKVQAGLLLALGEYSIDEARDVESDSDGMPVTLVRRLSRSPDAAVRSSAVWCLRRWGLKVETTEPTTESLPVANWLPTANQHEMIVVDRRHAEEPFQMGSYVSEPGTSWDERKHFKWIKRRFAVSAYETTVAQFRRFVEATPDASYVFRESDQELAPVTRVNWYLAARYCNWLSRQAGLPESEWCYEIKQDEDLGLQYRLASDYLSRAGFRLPTEAEWEYCCRAGTSTARPFGDSENRLSLYAWFASNSDNTTHAVGERKPNPLGFFDMLGNAREWCQEHWDGELTRIDTIYNNDHEDRLDVKTNRTRVTKGGSFDELASKLRSANRIGYHPQLRLDSLGFRVAQSIVVSDE